MVRLHFPSGQNYDCVMCGRGCESLWTIPVEDTVAERIQQHPLGLRVIQENGAAFSKDEKGGCVIHYADPARPRCGFLDDNKLCKIHAQLGMEAKPLTCQQFPFHVTATPDGVYVGVSFFCTSVRENTGRPLGEHEEWLRQLMKTSIRVTTIEADRVPVSSERVTDWDDFVAFEAEMRRRISEQGLDLTAQQALVLTALASQQEQPRLASGWDDFEYEEAPLGGQLATMLDTALYALVKLFLEDTSPERIGQLDQAYASGAELDLPEYAWKDSWFQLIRFQDQAVGEALEDELDRWVQMHLHRKALLVYRPLLDNLWMLALIPRFVRCTTALYASLHSRQQATQKDYFKALEIAEMYLGTNGLLPSRLSPRFTAHLMELL